MKNYTLSDEGGARLSITALDDKDAEKQACKWALEGDWDTSNGTVFTVVSVITREDTWRVTVAINPPVPRCETPEGHTWTAPYELLGGDRDNPGVWGNGGGVIIKEICSHCRLMKETNTWAQNPMTGELGLTSIKYRDRSEWEEAQDEQ